MRNGDIEHEAPPDAAAFVRLRQLLVLRGCVGEVEQHGGVRVRLQQRGGEADALGDAAAGERRRRGVAALAAKTSATRAGRLLQREGSVLGGWVPLLAVISCFHSAGGTVIFDHLANNYMTY